MDYRTASVEIRGRCIWIIEVQPVVRQRIVDWTWSKAGDRLAIIVVVVHRQLAWVIHVHDGALAGSGKNRHPGLVGADFPTLFFF